jgi:hypothetical protein
VTDIINDIVKHDAEASIVVCGHFNNHINIKYRELHYLDYTRALKPSTINHIMGVHLDQVFSRRVEITNTLVENGFDSGITDKNA